MKKIIFILSLFLFLKISDTKAQGLQPGECAIMFTYDAAGNLIQREFYCNTTGSVIYRTADSSAMETKEDQSKVTKEELVKVNAIMPNPTTGKFTVRLFKPLDNADVMLLDVNGKVMVKRRESGNTLDFDVSAQPAGMYLVRIEYQGKVYTFKVIKQ